MSDRANVLNSSRAEAQCCTNTVMDFPAWCSVALFRLNTIKLHLPLSDADRKLCVSLGGSAPLGKGVILCLQLSAVPHKCERRDGLRAHQRSSIWPMYRHGLRLKGRSQHLQSQIVSLLSFPSFLSVWLGAAPARSSWAPQNTPGSRSSAELQCQWAVQCSE